jgi:hypothetical protein
MEETKVISPETSSGPRHKIDVGTPPTNSVVSPPVTSNTNKSRFTKFKFLILGFAVVVAVSVTIGVRMSRSIKSETVQAQENDSQPADGLDGTEPYCVYHEEDACSGYKVSQIELKIPKEYCALVYVGTSLPMIFVSSDEWVSWNFNLGWGSEALWKADIYRASQGEENQCEVDPENPSTAISSIDFQADCYLRASDYNGGSGGEEENTVVELTEMEMVKSYMLVRMQNYSATLLITSAKTLTVYVMLQSSLSTGMNISANSLNLFRIL